MCVRDSKFLSRFYRELLGRLGTKLLFSTSWNPQKDDQTYVVNRTLGFILCDVVNGKMASRKDHLPLVKFAYNRFIYVTIGKNPFECVYEFNPLSPWISPPFLKMLC